MYIHFAAQWSDVTLTAVKNTRRYHIRRLMEKYDIIESIYYLVALTLLQLQNGVFPMHAFALGHGIIYIFIY